MGDGGNGFGGIGIAGIFFHAEGRVECVAAMDVAAFKDRAIYLHAFGRCAGADGGAFGRGL